MPRTIEDYRSFLTEVRKASGIDTLVPDESGLVSVRVDDEYNMGVYVITGMYAEFKRITPVYETEDYYIVRSDPTKTSNLLVFDEIIISGRNLENKKVIA